MAATLADERSNPLSVKEIADQLEGYAVFRFSAREKGDILNFFSKRPASSECYFSTAFVARPILTSLKNAVRFVLQVTRLQPWARNFKRVGVGDVAWFAAKIIQNVLH
jgi:hypothetical protein